MIITAIIKGTLPGNPGTRDKTDVEEFFAIVHDLGPEIRVGVSIYHFIDLYDALIQVKHGELEQPNAVIHVA